MGHAGRSRRGTAGQGANRLPHGARFGVRHLNAGLLEKLRCSTCGRAFAALCDRAGPDLTVALEFMPYSGMPDLATAWRVPQEAGRPNGGLIIDAWHGCGPA